METSQASGLKVKLEKTSSIQPRTEDGGEEGGEEGGGNPSLTPDSPATEEMTFPQSIVLSFLHFY